MPTTIHSGFYFVRAGFSLIFKPGLKRFVFIPLVLNIVFFLAFFYVSRYYFAEFSHWLESFLPSWLQWLEGFFWLIYFFLFFLIIIYTSVTITNLLAAPFNSLLAEKVEGFLTDKTPEKTRFITLLQDTPRMMGRQLAIIGYYLPRVVLICILFFIPFLQLIAPVLLFVFNAWFMALQMIDYPTDNQRVSFSLVKEKLRRRRFLTLTFGLAVLLISMVPFLNFFIIPAGVAGATKMWQEELKKE